MTNILVTGGAGYIGSHICKALANSGLTPVTYDNLVNGHEEAVKWGPLETGDIQDERRLKEVFRRYSPAAVIHLAAFAYVGESVTDPDKYYRNNLVGTLTLLEAMRIANVRRLVFSSSCAIYGTPDVVPITEETRQRPVNPYGRSKLMCEHMIEDHCAAYGLSAIGLRYFNAAGADPDGDVGEDHEPETHLVPLVLKVAAGTSDHIEIYGDDYGTADGTCIRDYIHVADLARAHVACLDVLQQTDGWRAFNLGTGNGISNYEIITAAERVTGRTVTVRVGPRRPGDPAILVADPSRAAAELGWKAEHSNIESILRTAWLWMTRGQRDDHLPLSQISD